MSQRLLRGALGRLVAAPETPRPFSESFSVLWSGRIAQELLNTPPREVNGARQITDEGYGFQSGRNLSMSIESRSPRRPIGAVAHTEKMPEAIAEIGAWWGITTAAPAGRTVKRVYAIDSYKENEFPGISEAFQVFRKRIQRGVCEAFFERSSKRALIQTS